MAFAGISGGGPILEINVKNAHGLVGEESWRVCRLPPEIQFRQGTGPGTATMSQPILPRLIRLRDAARYCGMDPNRFNAEVRPYLIEIPIGKQGIAFDRLDLDAWVDQYKDRNGRPGKATGGKPLWDRKFHQGSSREAISGTSEKRLEEERFKKALERATSKKRSAS